MPQEDKLSNLGYVCVQQKTGTKNKPKQELTEPQFLSPEAATDPHAGENTGQIGKIRV